MNNKNFNLIDYKGKYTIIQDMDIDLDGDIVVGTISKEDAIDEATERIEACRYYGIPAYIGEDKVLGEIYD